MAKVSGSVVLWFEDVEFEDDGDLSLRDQAHEALKGEVFGSAGDVVEIDIDEIKE